MLLQRDRAILVVIDLQSRLFPAIAEGSAVLGRCRVLIQAASRLGVPVMVTEENPAGLGHSVPAIAELVPADAIHEKMAFNAAAETAFMRRFAAHGRPQAVLCGMEAHVCVLQTALGLHAEGAQVFVAADAVGSRRSDDRAAALARLASDGVRVITAEMAVFEWTRTAADPAFRDMLKLVK
jgi:nicotinamidase-related amidase